MQAGGVGITVRQFRQLQARLEGKPCAPAAANPVVARPGHAPRPGRIILGVDPSLRATGYGVIRADASAPRALALGTIRCPADWPMSRCLAHIAATLRRLIRQHQPAECVVEGLFYAQNSKTALTMGAARGAALVAAAEAGLDIFEIAPRKVKLAIVGHGAAAKPAVARMVQRLLQLARPPAADAADALALALAHAQETGRYQPTPPRRI